MKKNLIASIDSPTFFKCRSVTIHISFESSRFKDSDELLVALRCKHYSLLEQREEKTQVLKSCNLSMKSFEYCNDLYTLSIIGKNMLFSAFI